MAGVSGTVLYNLLDNAIKNTPARGKVTLGSALQNGKS